MAEVDLWLRSRDGRVVVWLKWFCGCVIEEGIRLFVVMVSTWVKQSMDEATKKLNTQFLRHLGG